MSKIDQPYNICAIDASTNSLAFAFYTHKKLTGYGKINFEGGNIYEKVIDATAKTKALFDHYNMMKTIVIEHTIFMNSPKTQADLALVQGGIIGGAGMAGIEIIGKVSPVTWQLFLGNKKRAFPPNFYLSSSLFNLSAPLFSFCSTIASLSITPLCLSCFFSSCFIRSIIKSQLE